jgi:N-acetyl-anhydromuramyl-L-alanine amidase AmpD
MAGRAHAISRRSPYLCLCASVSLAVAGCLRPVHRPGELLPRTGDEIMVCGQLFHTGTPVVLWTDPGGYDAYRVERRFAPPEEASWEKSQSNSLKSPNRYDLRRRNLTSEQIERIRGGGWDLPLLQETVDQFVLHYDVCGTSRQCFKVLHDLRGLSVHFMLDLDGTIYQTLDLKERAWHATTSNHRSVGIEIANMGAYADGEEAPFDKWYARDSDGRVRITIPPALGDGGVRTAYFVGRPARDEIVTGEIQGRLLRQYDLTPQQYAALIKLTATLCKVFPKIKADYPRDASGALITRKLPDDELERYEGILGHFHVQTNKVDPGPAFQWDRLIDGVRRHTR